MQPGSLAFSAARVLFATTLLAAPLAFGAVKAWCWASLAVLAVLLLLLWGAGCVQQGALKIRWSPLYLPALLFVILAVAQFFGHLTPDPIGTRESLLKLVTDMIFFFLAGQLMASSSERTWRGFGFTVLLYAFLLSLFAVVQFFSSPGLIYWSVKPRWGSWIFGPYVNHNHYAGLMEMLIPIAVGYVLSRSRSDPARGSLGFAVLAPVASLLVSGSRGGFIALLTESLILIGIILGPACTHGRRTLAPAVVLGMTASALIFFSMDTGEISKRLATVANLTRSPEATFGERKVIALDCLRILHDRLWLGAGLGTFETVYPRYRSFASDLVWDHAHNDYAEALAETGLAGGFLILAALVIFFYLASKNLGDRLKDEAGWIQLGAALGVCGLLVHSFVDFNLHIPANAAWFVVCAAWATGEFSGPHPIIHKQGFDLEYEPTHNVEARCGSGSRM